PTAAQDGPQTAAGGRRKVAETRPPRPVRACAGGRLAPAAPGAREEPRARARVRRRRGLLLRAPAPAAGEEQDRDRECAEAGHATQDTALLRGNRGAHDLDRRGETRPQLEGDSALTDEDLRPVDHGRTADGAGGRDEGGRGCVRSVGEVDDLLVRTRLDDELVAHRRRVYEDRRVVAGGGPVGVATGDEPDLRAGTLERGGGEAGGPTAPEHEYSASGRGHRRG